MNSPLHKPTFVDYLHLHFLVLIWGFTAILGKLINPQLSRISLTFFRTLLAAVGLAVVLWLWKEWKRVPANDRWAMLGVGAIMGLHWLTFFGSAHVSSASVCLAGMSTTSLFTSLLEPLFARRRVRPLEILLSLLVIVGLYLIFRFEVDQSLGLGLALVSAFLAALFTIANSRFARRHNALLITFYEMNGATMAMLIGLAGVAFTSGLTDEEMIPQSTDWLWLGILAFVCTVYAYSASVHLLRKVSPFTLNLTINLEPVYGMALAYFILNERMTAGFYAGSVVILLSVIIYPMLNARFAK
ncbi:EamA family transporter [Runella sp. CRIBMP]|uniref:DMT family transporter n=1 Tax=Runella sp. CRIBMP TaxID=2683261 RepID=UPI00141344B3|nr:EamA family transporter [Runella sp. CRIBMP]NBB19995.1 EamA family transporter [Runella sp. CRIBMP]